MTRLWGRHFLISTFTDEETEACNSSITCSKAPNQMLKTYKFAIHLATFKLHSKDELVQVTNISTLCPPNHHHPGLTENQWDTQRQACPSHFHDLQYISMHINHKEGDRECSLPQTLRSNSMSWDMISKIPHLGHLLYIKQPPLGCWKH